ncbi:MAG: hypothetical protein HKN32_06720, partial [Flavobacteriales bacterium]|nr:hypothetical protein [Flavobacteriales bacterium]
MSLFILDWNRLIRILYLTGLGMLLVSLPIFNVGMSISVFWMGGVWLLDFLNDAFGLKDPGRKFRQLRQNHWALLLLSIYALHVLGLLYTTDFQYALKDLRIKVPLLILPFVVAAFPAISKKQFIRYTALFTVAVSFSALCSLFVYWGIVDRQFEDIREITHLFVINVSHIRLSLMAALAVAFSAWLVLKTKWGRAFIIPLIGLLYFLWVVESMTGFSVLFVTIAFYFFHLSISASTKKFKGVLIGAAAIIIIGGTWIVGSAYQDYHDMAKEYDIENLPAKTALGNPYDHQIENRQVENGHYVW